MFVHLALYHITGGGAAAELKELLQKIAACYATAMNCSPKDTRAHIGLALALEEQFYVKDLYGIEGSQVCE